MSFVYLSFFFFLDEQGVAVRFGSGRSQKDDDCVTVETKGLCATFVCSVSSLRRIRVGS